MNGKLCPRCRLPSNGVGRVFAASSADRERHGVVAFCRRCDSAMVKLSRRAMGKLIGPALERALDDPARFTVRLYPEIGTCLLAVGMLGHPAYSARALQAVGWGAPEVIPLT